MAEIIHDKIDFLKFLSEQESQYVVPASTWTDEVIDEINGIENLRGDTLPWPETHENIRLRPGEVSIWGGYNGHGKSQFLGMICAWGIKKKKWLVCSMEMPPRKTLKRMSLQVLQEKNEQRARDFLKWTDNRLWIYDQTDTVQHERLLGVVHYAFKTLDMDHIIIDSLMKCGFRGSKDTISSQRVDFVDRLCWAAKKYDKHIHLVHHMRKGEGVTSEHRIPGKHDFRGEGEIVDLVDNAFIIHRNKEKEDKMQQGLPNSGFDATMSVVKQRHGDWEGQYGFFFDRLTNQYTKTIGGRLSYRAE